ncbi:MAG: diaminopimelate epimerase [Lachnospiraceae bacterium]|nr:diaminopimelate epimerase [Lachnospiraceae bacterium]
MKFTKMHGLGNDYIYIETFTQELKGTEKAELVRTFSDRHFGIGGDGVIFIHPSAQADCEMEMFNADGSRAEMCGNGIRCVGKLLYDLGLTDHTEISVISAGKMKYLKMSPAKEEKNPITGMTYGKRKDGQVIRKVEVNMGEPILQPELIPVDLENTGMPDTADGKGNDSDICIDRMIQSDESVYRMTCVSMGNPHAVIFVEDTEQFPVTTEGPKLETHSCFPKRANIEFIQILDRNHLKMRVWERGTGETLACGTGACAAAVAAILNGYTEETVTVHLLGGDLEIRWDREKNEVFMTGTAVTVFEGEI